MPDFGPLAADDDEELLGYFQVTNQVSQLISPQHIPEPFLFVARPGAGKTALVRWLNQDTHKRTILFLSSDKTRMVFEDSQANPTDLRKIMSVELSAGIIFDLQQRFSLADELNNACSAFLHETLGERVSQFFKERLDGLSFMGYGFSLSNKTERNQYIVEIRKKQKIEEAERILRLLIQQIDVTLVVDNPEAIVGQGLQDVTQDNAIRIGAFLHVLNRLHLLGIQVVVFTKEHILQSVQEIYLDYSHFSDRIEGLAWTAEDLLDMLQRRIAYRFKTTWKNIFAVTTEEMQDSIFPFLVNGPRDLIYICNLAIRHKNTERITATDLENAIKTLLPQKWLDISRQYDAVWPNISALIQNIIKDGLRTFADPISPGDFRTILRDNFQDPSSDLHRLRKEQRWIDSAVWDSPSIPELMFLIGCLGYITDGHKVFPWMGRSLEMFRIADTYFVSPLFRLD